MPTISRFFGIVITMYYEDHPPHHVHARYGQHHARFAIEAGIVLSGRLPPRATRLVQEWIDLYRPHLLNNWQRMLTGEPMQQVEGLE